MSVRRTALIVAILAIIACGFGSIQADAASTPRGQAATSPLVLLGGHCVTVHSNVNRQTGTVCVYLARQGGEVRGEVVFTSHSGLLRRISAQILRLSADNQVILTLRNPSETVTGIGGALPLSWWDERSEVVGWPDHLRFAADRTPRGGFGNLAGSRVRTPLFDPHEPRLH